MHPVYIAALELQKVLRKIGRPYCFIGGLALQRWGELRTTQDADATVLSSFEFDEFVIGHLASHFKFRRQGGATFARQNRVVLLEASNGIALDIALGAFEFEARSIERASDWKISATKNLRTCSAEDLVVHKAFAARDKDWVDLKGILVRQRMTLHVAQVFQELGPLVLLKEDDSIMPRLKKLMKESGIQIV